MYFVPGLRIQSIMAGGGKAVRAAPVVAGVGGCKAERNAGALLASCSVPADGISPPAFRVDLFSSVSLSRNALKTVCPSVILKLIKLTMQTNHHDSHATIAS